jgi:phosphoserine phosphatase
MKTGFFSQSVVLLASVFVAACAASTPAIDPLPSWNEGAAKSGIIDFVNSTTSTGNSKFVEPGERIAVFDNDGTLWAEKPAYFQLLFAISRIREMAEDHPEWQTLQPFKAVLEDDMNALMASGERGLLTLISATHSGMSTDEFAAVVTEWATTARHPDSGLLFTQMIYQPMLELLGYLRASGYKVFIVSGGGIEFMRPWTERVYGVPPDQVVGTSLETRYEVEGSTPRIVREPGVHFINDKAGKPVGINRFIGRRPVIAGGNSDGDFEMLEWTTSANGARLGLLVHHTDAVREWAYDRESAVGRLDRGLDEADSRGWIVIDMARDWSIVFPN